MTDVRQLSTCRFDVAFKKSEQKVEEGKQSNVGNRQSAVDGRWSDRRQSVAGWWSFVVGSRLWPFVGGHL